MSEAVKVYSVDRALEEQRPRVELRGEVYLIANHTTEQRIRYMLDLAEAQEELEMKAQRGEVSAENEDDFVELRGLYAKAVKGLLDDVPDEVAETITEMEYQALQVAVLAAYQELEWRPTLKNSAGPTAAQEESAQT